ncbi:MAG: O-antigen ligase family protein [Pseudomonadota bacterium]
MEKWRRIINILFLFYLGPLCLYLGMAAQNAGLVICFILAPFLSFSLGDPRQRYLLRKLGISLVSIWLLWPVFNVISMFFPLRHTLMFPTTNWPGPLDIRDFARMSGPVYLSQVPSSVGISGAFLWILSQVKRRDRRISFSYHAWLLMLAIFCVIFFFYFAYQHVTGFDFRSSQSYLPNMRFPGGSYRIQGFSGHPLTIAGISLSLVGFSSTLFKKAFIRGSRNQTPLLIILLTNLFFLFASGGRTALFIALGWLFILAILGAKNFLRWRVIFLLSLVLILATLSLVFFSSVGQRYLEMAEFGQTGNAPNRLTFWRVHWQMFLDSPFWGQGYSHLTKGVRLMYYDAMGLRDFPEKFNAHNIFFETLSNIGALGSLILTALLFRVYFLLKQICATTRTSTSLFHALSAGVALNIAHGFTQNVFFDSGVTVVLMCLLWILVWSAADRNRFEND